MQQRFQALSRSSQADILLVITTLLAGAGWIFSKEALQGLEPIFFISIRFTLAGVVLVLLGQGVLRRLTGLEFKQDCLVYPVVSVL